MPSRFANHPFRMNLSLPSCGVSVAQVSVSWVACGDLLAMAPSSAAGQGAETASAGPDRILSALRSDTTAGFKPKAKATRVRSTGGMSLFSGDGGLSRAALASLTVDVGDDAGDEPSDSEPHPPDQNPELAPVARVPSGAPAPSGGPASSSASAAPVSPPHLRLERHRYEQHPVTDPASGMLIGHIIWNKNAGSLDAHCAMHPGGHYCPAKVFGAVSPVLNPGMCF